MRKKTILYRGNLKSCNYNCSYCPFAKHKSSKAELEKDRKNFIRFCDSVEKRAQEFSIGAVFVTPYGEASIHSWYWKGLAHLSKLDEIDQVGMQTNLSLSILLPDGIEGCPEGISILLPEGKEGCPEGISILLPEGMEGCPEGKTSALSLRGVENCMKLNDFYGGKREKLCIWATFHPEMTDVDTFVLKCHQLIRHHVQLCVGAVGVPEHIHLLRKLREKLSKSIYVWINKMDGLRRNYTAEEIKAFSELDPFFGYELGNFAADVKMCRDRCFVEADGKIRTCNISAIKSANWYNGGEAELFEPVCSRKRCSCYLAYGGRTDFELNGVFGRYPVFRIPKRFQAVFFDLDGTLIENGSKRGLSEQVSGKLKELKQICPIFLATSMPEEAVRRRLKGDMELFSGGIYASGACMSCGDDTVRIYPVKVHNLSEIMQFAVEAKAKIRIYRKKGVVYKITLIKRHYGCWDDREAGRMAELLETSNCRFFIEKYCLEIVDRNRDKGTGIAEICAWLGISAENVLAVGNDREDAAMKRVCGVYQEGLHFTLKPDFTDISCHLV